jgi:hypothetical protein
MYYFYLWSNHLGRTCFGITGNPENRRRKYEGHCGHEVLFEKLYEGPQALIEDLEDRIKGEFFEYLFGTGIGKYEWIRENVPTEQVYGWVDWEVAESYNKQIALIESPST